MEPDPHAPTRPRLDPRATRPGPHDLRRPTAPRDPEVAAVSAAAPRDAPGYVSVGFKRACDLARPRMGVQASGAAGVDRVVAFDLETTGLDPREDRIVEFAFLVLDADLRELDRWHEVVDPQRPIPEEAAQVHGITGEDVDGAPTFEHLAPVVQGLIDRSALMAYNHEFDVEFLDAELARAGGSGIGEDVPAIDPMVHFKRHHPDTSNRLEHAVQHYLDRTLEGAHRAIHDTAAMVDVFRAMQRVHPDLDGTLQQAFVEPRDWVDEERKLYEDGDGTVRFGFGKHEGEPVRGNRSYAEWMLEADFPEETKARLREVLREPTAPEG